VLWHHVLFLQQQQNSKHTAAAAAAQTAAALLSSYRCRREETLSLLVSRTVEVHEEVICLGADFKEVTGAEMSSGGSDDGGAVLMTLRLSTAQGTHMDRENLPLLTALADYEVLSAAGTDSVLNVGCGTGLWGLVGLAGGRCASVMGVDIDPLCTALAHRNAVENGLMYRKEGGQGSSSSGGGSGPQHQVQCGDFFHALNQSIHGE
jgi:methylase of polypeptide subunit release factors